MSLPEKICMLPWISVETSPVGTARPCCLAKDEIVDTTGKTYNLRDHTLEEIYHSEYMQDLRTQFLAGEKPTTCQRCWDEEAAGRVSKRINSKIRLKEYYNQVDWQNTDPDQLWFLDLKLGNICNLKCRICGSWSSSRWAQEEMDYVPESDRKQHLAYSHLRSGKWPREAEAFWENLKTLLPNVKYFEFTGGEPFLIEQQFELLRYAVDQGYSKDIEIHYNTNGTVFPEAHKLWDQFRHVEIAFSVDNINHRFEYERYGANWKQVSDNIVRFNNKRTNKLSTQLCTTINVQNVYYLPELCNWIKTQSFDHVFFNMLHDPWHMNIGYMTAAAKKLVVDRLTKYPFDPKFKTEALKIVKFITNGPGSDGREFVQKITTTDKYRKQNFLDSHTEIAKAMGL